uniref:Uncharacterized protein n=1 Tax=Oryzias latipes TaxID=8090 RepID=A0A3B3H7J9_ORYLA
TPGPPGPINIKELTKESATISWEAPAVDGGAPVNNYIIERREASMRAYKTVTSKCSKTSYKIDDTTKSSVSLAWSPPDDEGDARVDGYMIEMQKVGSVTWVKCNTTPSLICEYTLTNMPQGEEFKFRVMACNAGGCGEPAEVPGTVIVKEMLESPDYELDLKYRDVYVVRHGGVIRLSVPIKGKPQPTCKWSKDGDTVSTKAMIASSEDGSELVIKGAERSDSGVSQWYQRLLSVSTFLFLKFLSLPLEKIMDVTKSSVALAWSRPKDDGGSAITGYYVEYKETTVETWSRHQAKITSTMFTLHGLTPDTSYQFRIVAVNDIGESEAGVESDVVTCKDPFGESHFTKISSLTAKLGQPAVMKCQIIGRPVPEIKWYHAGREIIASRKYEMSSDGRNHSLSIMTDQQEDEGEYTCKAINDAGCKLYYREMPHYS